MQTKITEIEHTVYNMRGDLDSVEEQIEKLSSQIATQYRLTDSLDKGFNQSLLQANALERSHHAQATEQITASTQHVSTLATIGIWLIAGLLLMWLVSYWWFNRRLARGDLRIDDIHKSQARLMEQSNALDTKLLSLLDKQLEYQQNSQATNSEPDHGLALKIADEITRIELNLSRMDPTIRGYKQLSRAVDRIKNNFAANGYELVTYIGQPYNEHMRVNADFFIDESLPIGSRIITSATYPQVHYRGQLLQKATVKVSQNI